MTQLALRPDPEERDAAREEGGRPSLTAVEGGALVGDREVSPAFGHMSFPLPFFPLMFF